jgi:hypothetical protein
MGVLSIHYMNRTIAIHASPVIVSDVIVAIVVHLLKRRFVASTILFLFYIHGRSFACVALLCCPRLQLASPAPSVVFLFLLQSIRQHQVGLISSLTWSSGANGEVRMSGSRNRVDIASRSQSAPPSLSEHCCLRCAKRVYSRVHDGMDAKCDWKGINVKCGYCAAPSIKKPCLEVSYQRRRLYRVTNACTRFLPVTLPCSMLSS